MKKIEISHNLTIPGWGIIPAGQQFKVEKYNSRYVYIKLKERVILRVARKADCKIIY